MVRNPITTDAIVSGAIRTATVILIAGAIITIASQQTMANTEMAKKTGQPCAKCHAVPPALNDYGKKYRDSSKK